MAMYSRDVLNRKINFVGKRICDPPPRCHHVATTRNSAIYRVSKIENRMRKCRLGSREPLIVKRSLNADFQANSPERRERCQHSSTPLTRIKSVPHLSCLFRCADKWDVLFSILSSRAVNHLTSLHATISAIV